MSPGASLVSMGLGLVAAAGAAWLLQRRCLGPEAGLLEIWLAWILGVLALVAGVGEGLSVGGWLGVTGYLLGTAGLAGALLCWSFRQVAADARALRELARRTACRLRQTGVVAWGLVAVLLALGLLSTLVQPVVYDTLTYRLPRIGQWLLDGRVHFLNQVDPRLNYPFVPDLLVAWLLAGLPSGYLPAALSQWVGGLLLMGATAGLARQSGLGAKACVGACWLLFAMANVAPQFTSVHSDLLTAGILASAVYLWAAALERGRGSVLGGLGAGLALGCKSSVFYFGPAALLWIACLAWRHRMPVRRWAVTVSSGALGVALFACPVFWMNARHYGGPFGPADFVAKHHAGRFTDKILLNSGTMLVQLFDPNSQPWGLQGASRRIGRALDESQRDDDWLIWEDTRRQSTLAEIFDRTTPDADVTTFGLIPVFLFGAGLLEAVARPRRRDARTILLWGGGVLVFLGFYNGMQRWHPFAFRYFTLAAAWVPVVAAWGIEQQRSRPVRLLLWGLLAYAGASVLWIQTTRTAQSGWRAATEPGRSHTYHVYEAWRRWARELLPNGGSLTVALPFNRPLAAFYRGAGPLRIELAPSLARSPTAEQCLRSGHSDWIVTDLPCFMGREGAVVTSTWLENGDETSPFSLAAYRLPRPGEIRPPAVYRQERVSRDHGVRWQWLIEPGDDPGVRFRLVNPGAQPVPFTVVTPARRQTGVLPARGSCTYAVPLAPGSVSELSFELPDPSSGPAASVRLLAP